MEVYCGQNRRRVLSHPDTGMDGQAQCCTERGSEERQGRTDKLVEGYMHKWADGRAEQVRRDGRTEKDRRTDGR